MKTSEILQVQIASKTIQLILQSRVDVKKAHQKQLGYVLKQIKNSKGNPYGGSIHTFLNQIINKQIYNTRPIIVSQFTSKKAIYVSLIFYLTEKSTKVRCQAQHWQIQIKKKEQQLDIECSSMVFNLFQQLILLVNQQPLFSQYFKNKLLNSSYKIEYKLIFNQSSKCEYSSHISSMHSMYSKVRQSQTLKISLLCYYKQQLKNLCQKQQLLYRKSKTLLQNDQQNDKHSSLYTFYDKQFDITMITSNQALNYNQIVEQIQLEKHYSDEFQIIFQSEDERFLQQAKELFLKMDKLEEKQQQFLLK